MNHRLRYGLIGAGSLVLMFAAWLFVFLPASFLRQSAFDFKAHTGQTLIIKGGGALRFSPRLGILLKDVEVPGASAIGANVMKAKSVFIPVSATQFVGLGGALENAVLDQAEFSYVLDEEGRANLRFADGPVELKVDASAPAPKPLHFDLRNSRFEIVNQQTGARIYLAQVDGLVAVDADQSVALKASATVKDQRVHIDANLKSFSRTLDEGSPLDLTLETSGTNFEFTGRVVAGQKIGLAGLGAIESVDAKKALAWLGVNLHSLNNGIALALTANVDSEDAAFTFKKVSLQLGQMKGQGEMRYSQAGERPFLAFDLGIDQLDLGIWAQADATSQQSGWREQPYDLHDFNSVDVAFRISANKVVSSPLVLGPAQISGSVKSGAFDAKLESTQNGTASIKYDTNVDPVSLKLDMAFKNLVTQQMLPRFAGMNWASGLGDVTANVSALGASPAALISSLTGKGEIRVREAKVMGADLAGLSTQALSGPSQGWVGQETAPVAAVIPFVLADGIASVEGTSITAPGVKIQPAGEVDLLRQALNLLNTVTLNRGDGKVLKIKATGAWGNPLFEIAKGSN
jgi:AsmA protein